MTFFSSFPLQSLRIPLHLRYHAPAWGEAPRAVVARCDGGGVSVDVPVGSLDDAFAVALGTSASIIIGVFCVIYNVISF